MSTKQVRRLPMPEAGAEARVYMYMNHGCAMARALRSDDDPDVDLVMFPVGFYGGGMPAGVPFEVVSTEPCGACDKLLRSMFEWSAPRIWVP